MNTIRLLLLCLLFSAVTSCDRNKPVPAIPEKKSTFQKTVFTQPQSGSTITLISEKECEIDNRGNIILSEYSRQDNKLRVVIRVGGGASVSYFDLLQDGLRADGQIFLLPEPLNKVREQMRIAREAEEARARVAQMEKNRVAEERRSANARIAAKFLGTWRDENSVTEYFANGVGLVKRDNGDVSECEWAIEEGRLTINYPGRRWIGYTIVEITPTTFTIQDGKEIYHATRTK